MQIGEVCSREVYLVRPDEPLAVAARLMDEQHIGAIVVVEPHGASFRPVGIVTDRDIVRGQLARGSDLFQMLAADVMTANPVTLGEEDDLADGIRRLVAAGVRRAPVVNAAGELIGIVSLDDLLPVVAEELGELARLVGRQASRKARLR